MLVGLVVVTALGASGCGESRYGGLSRDAARAKADEITSDLRAVVRNGRFDFIAIQKASVSGHEAWKVKFALVTHISPLAPSALALLRSFVCTFGALDQRCGQTALEGRVAKRWPKGLWLNYLTGPTTAYSVARVFTSTP